MTQIFADADTPVRLFYTALDTGDLALVDRALAPDWEALPALRTGTGPEGWKRSVEHLRAVFGELSVTVEDVVVEGDRVAVRTVNRGIHRGELLGVSGTGRVVEFRATDVHQVENGVVRRTWHLEDYLGIALQLGLQLVPVAGS